MGEYKSIDKEVEFVANESFLELNTLEGERKRLTIHIFLNEFDEDFHLKSKSFSNESKETARAIKDAINLAHKMPCTFDQMLTTHSEMCNKLDFDREDLYDVTVNMRNYGGSFVKALAECYIRADQNNKRKLEMAFAGYFNHYHKMKS